MFSPETKLTVYDRDIWWSDKWNPLDYGTEYDLSKPFFVQFQELMHRVPLANLGNTNCVKTEYGNHNNDCKNCYLIYASFGNENVAYAHGAVNVKDSFDIYTMQKGEQNYDDTCNGGLYRTHFTYDSDDCIDSMFLTACLNIQNSLGCINLRHKSHCIFNKQYSKEEYDKKIKEYDFGSYNNLKKFEEGYKNFIKKYPRRFAYIWRSRNVTGDNILTSKNSQYIFDVYGEAENAKYITHAWDVKESYDGYGTGAKMEFLYEGIDVGVNALKNLFAILTHSANDTNYTYMCYGASNLFGCVGVRDQDYVILNKKYSKEEYRKLVPKIVKHMSDMPYADAKGRVYKYGEFFPPELSPFFYNETIAGEYFPKTKEEVLASGFKWKEKTHRDYKIEVEPEDLPDHIKDTPEDIVGKVIGCQHRGECNEQCTEAFKIIPSEIAFLKRMNIALPRLCPNCRHFARLRRRNPLKLWHRQCMCEVEKHGHKGVCPNEFETSYAPERPEIIYCERCYQQEVY